MYVQPAALAEGTIQVKVNQSLLGTEAQAQMNAVTVADAFLFLAKSYL
ncbi:hypothetical protein [Paenibacillus tyrfis]|nr:hypothetical protein [Paenibacillus tyrfis]